MNTQTLHNNSMAQQTIRFQGLPIDCQPHVNLTTDRSKEPFSPYTPWSKSPLKKNPTTEPGFEPETFLVSRHLD